jgi:hypothetical protein
MLVKFKLEGELKVELKSKKCNQMKCGNSKVLMLTIQEHFGMKHEMMDVSFLFSSKQYPSCKGLIKSLENIYHIGKVLIPFLSNFQPNKLTMDISSSWTLVDDWPLHYLPTMVQTSNQQQLQNKMVHEIGIKKGTKNSL